MKSVFFLALSIGLVFISCGGNKETKDTASETAKTDTTVTASYYIDVHDLEPGKVTFADVEAAHQKDLATQGKYGVEFLKFWVDEDKGKVYCLSKANDMESVKATHQEAHGLVPGTVYKVSEGPEAPAAGNKPLFIDVHYAEPGKIDLKELEAAHNKDLAAQAAHNVNFINYWVDQEKGVIMCLAEAPDSNAVKATHKEAHGMVPAYVLAVKQGQ